MPEFSDELFAPANGLEICYQEMGDPDGEPLLLVMGLATQMIAWDDALCSLLAERGFRVVRFDNRDIGRSTKIDWAGAPSLLDTALSRRAGAAYLLRDMAADCFGLLDHLGIDSAHVAGASMGGMIAQTMAIERPQRVRSMVSIMSTTGNRWTGLPTLKAMGVLVTKRPNDREAFIERGVQTFRTIGSPGFDFDEARVRELSGRAYDRMGRGAAAGVARQLHAITASGDRTRRLELLELPATVIHGNRDPLIRLSGGRATAKAIPGARLKIIDGMGHDLPRVLYPTFVEEIAETAARAKDSQAPASATRARSRATVAQPGLTSLEGTA